MHVLGSRYQKKDKGCLSIVGKLCTLNEYKMHFASEHLFD